MCCHRSYSWCKTLTWICDNFVSIARIENEDNVVGQDDACFFPINDTYQSPTNQMTFLYRLLQISALNSLVFSYRHGNVVITLNSYFQILLVYLKLHQFKKMSDGMLLVYIFSVFDGEECASNPCESGGTCVEGYFNYTCVCPLWRHGERCQCKIAIGYTPVFSRNSINLAILVLYQEKVPKIFH